MNYKVERLSDVPAVLTTVSKDFEINRELEAMNRDTLAILDPAEVPLFLITDFQLSLGIDDLFQSASTLRRENSIWKHPNIRQVIIITDDPLLRLAAQGMKSPILGGFNLKLSDSVEEALAYVRSQR